MQHLHTRTLSYHNLFLVFFGLFVASLLYMYEPFHEFLLHLGGFGYVGAFFAGVLFVSSFTAATGILLLLVFAESYPILYIGLCAGLGAVMGDMLIFSFVKNSLTEEISTMYHMIDPKNHIRVLMRSRYFAWAMPLLGALIIASPLPDEVGVSLMGISKMNPAQFMFVSFLLNTLGIVFILYASTYIKP